jgi:hypothetical protein
MNNNIRRYPYPPSTRVPSPPIGYPNLRQPPLPNKKIRDYLFWSIINIFIGGILAGLVAVLFSYFTRESKRENKLNEARKWSKRALVCNIHYCVGRSRYLSNNRSCCRLVCDGRKSGIIVIIKLHKFFRFINCVL